MKKIKGLFLAEGMTPHEVKRNGWTDEMPLEAIYENTNNHAAVIYGPNPLSNEIEFFRKTVSQNEGEVFGMFHAHHSDDDRAWAASYAKRVFANGLYPVVNEASDLPDAVDNLSLHLNQAHEVVNYNNQRRELCQAIASAVLVWVCRIQENGMQRNFIVSANVGKGMAFKVPKNISNEKIAPLFVEPVDNNGEPLIPVIGEADIDIAPHPPLEANRGDKVVILSGPVKPDLVGESKIYDDIRDAVSAGKDKLEIAAILTNKRRKLGQSCLAAVIEI